MSTTSVAAAAPRTSSSARLARILRDGWPVVLVAVLGIASWTLLTETVYKGKGYLVPSPLQVLGAVGNNAGILLAASLTTLKEATFGYLLAIAGGVAFAAVMSQSKVLERSIYPYAVLLQTVPVVAVAPLIVLWFGYNDMSVVIISLIMSLFPIVNNTLLGLRSTSRNLTELFALHNRSRFTAVPQAPAARGAAAHHRRPAHLGGPLGDRRHRRRVHHRLGQRPGRPRRADRLRAGPHGHLAALRRGDRRDAARLPLLPDRQRHRQPAAAHWHESAVGH